MPREPSALEKFAEGFGGGLKLSLPQVLKDIGEQQNLRQFGSLLQSFSPQAGEGMEQTNLSNIASNPLLLAAAGKYKDVLSKAGEAQARERKLQSQEKQFLTKQNQPLYSKATDKLEEIEGEQLRLGRLEELSNSGKIAKSWIVQPFYKDGTLRAPYLFSPETQEFMKIVTDFVRGAKDSFGARVTNFELNTFLQKLPSLLNSPKGRQAVINNLQKMAKINELYNKGLVEAYDEQGLGKIDQSQAKKIARQKYGKQIQELKKEYIKPSQTNKLSQEGMKQQKGKTLTPELIQKFLKAAKNNPDEAARMAKEQGYLVE